jgi:5'-phosphate synthase pdxT subunit
MAKEVTDGVPGQPLLGLMEIQVRRNAYGGQVNSFEVELAVPVLGDRPFPATFIRAPIIESVGAEVKVLARLKDGTRVAARQGNLVATTFHPELVADDRFHRCFGGLCRAARRGGS